MKWSILFILWLFLISGFPAVRGQSQPSTGTIRGSVTAPAVDELTQEILRGRALMRYRNPGTHIEPVVDPYRFGEKAVVFIETVREDSAFPPPVVHPQLRQMQIMFHPLVLPVLSGSTVDFPNDDDLYHNVFSYSQVRVFDLGRYPQGHSRSVVFSKPGVVKVYCDIHSHMYATILVLQNPYFAVPDDDGSYSIDSIPAGNYRLTYWYGRRKVSTVQVTVTPNQTVIVNFAYAE